MMAPPIAELDAYILLRTALNMFEKPPSELDGEQLQKVSNRSAYEYDLETRVLNSSEADTVSVSDREVEKAYQLIQDRFNDTQEFHTTLAMNDLDPVGFKAAIRRECLVNAILRKVASRSAQVSDVEISIFYHSHPEKFRMPEKRQARHILISINSDYPENTYEKALERIIDIKEQLKRKPFRFPELALKNSECPTAMNGGDLGTITPGILYPELDAVLFKMKEQAISEVIQTELGFHLIQCLKITHAETISLQRATPKIRQLMQERSRLLCQRLWLESLSSTTM